MGASCTAMGTGPQSTTAGDIEVHPRCGPVRSVALERRRRIDKALHAVRPT